jgi:TRAP transporter TAXI family solute receptor
MRSARVAAAAVAVLLSTGTPVACGGKPDAPPDRLTVAAGAAGDVYFALGQALTGAAKGARVLETGGSLDNLRLVTEGRADVGFATVDAVTLAAHGDAPFTSALPLMALARLYDDYLQIVVRADSAITQVGDLAGRTVSTGAPGSGTDVVVARVLQAAGHALRDVKTRQLPPAESAAALRSGALDAFVITGGLPMPAVQRLSEQRPIRLVTLRSEIADLQAQYGEQYQPRTIPARTYGVPREVETLGVANVLVVRSDLPEQTAYRITKLLFDAKADLVRAHQEARRLDRRSALATFPVPLHPGAASYYRDQKVLA